MAQAQDGNTVKVHYTGKLADGTTFDSSEGREPLEVTLGEGQVIPGFENAIRGMAVGDSKDVQLPPDDAYGDRIEQLVQKIGKEQIPDNLELQIGQQLQVETEEGQPVVVMVAGIDDDGVTLDGNHPLAGQVLHFSIEMVEIS